MASNNRSAAIIGVKDTEDPFKVGYLGQPSANEHFHLHPHDKRGDSLLTKIWGTRDIFFEEHWEVKNTLFYGLKGSIFGTIIGGSIYLMNLNLPPAVWNKVRNQLEIHDFVIPRVMFHLLKPVAFTGFILGAAWHVWYNLTWAYQSSKPRWVDNVFGTAIFTSAATAALWHPKRLYLGFLVGLALGGAKYYISQPNAIGLNDKPGFYIPIGEIDDDEKQKQEYKDYIHRLSMQPQVRYRLLENL